MEDEVLERVDSRFNEIWRYFYFFFYLSPIFEGERYDKKDTIGRNTEAHCDGSQ